MGNKKKMTVLDFQKYKDEGRKFSFVTAYDYTTASIVNESDCEIILVGDSLGMIMLGYNTTVPVTVDDMIHHIRPVVKGAPDTFIIGDMPFGSYNVSKEQAIETANRITKETLCDCVKLEGGANMAPTIRAMVDAGINVMGHIGMTPQTATSSGKHLDRLCCNASCLLLWKAYKKASKGYHYRRQPHSQNPTASYCQNFYFHISPPANPRQRSFQISALPFPQERITPRQNSNDRQQIADRLCTEGLLHHCKKCAGRLYP